MTPERIVHPGPPAAERINALPCTAERRELVLAAGRPLDAAVTEALAGTGADGAYLRIADAAADSLDFVRPAPAPGDGHAAWYSDTTRLAPATITEAGIHAGRRDGAPFLHVHGLWQGADGETRMGHVLPHATRLSRDTTVTAWLIRGARLEVAADAETQFPLFRPVPTDAGPGRGAVLATIRPNEDIRDAIATMAAEAGLATAEIQGIGSAVGTRFADGGALDSYATEVLVRAGHVSGPEVTLDVASVGFDGGHLTGALGARNRVCVTFELLLLGA
ncbi:hypothetical protein [Tranquillimonas rosea]|uniref:hypothetical protein n=1 Tax=Tranquillimonas rosea TaxID=641238 RepID=UPI003BA8CC2B